MKVTSKIKIIESYAQWVEKFIIDVINEAELKCDEIIIWDIEPNRRIFLIIDGQNYTIRTWSFRAFEIDENKKVCSEFVDYSLFREIEDGSSEDVDYGSILIEWKNNYELTSNEKQPKHNSPPTNIKELNIMTQDEINKRLEYYKNLSVYDGDQIIVIGKGFEAGLSQDQIDYYAVLNKEGKPTYDVFQMIIIHLGFSTGLPKEQIDFYSAVDENGEPIYTSELMDRIRKDFLEGLPMEEVRRKSRLYLEELEKRRRWLQQLPIPPISQRPSSIEPIDF